MTLSKLQIALYLILIGVISIALKLYLVDFSIPVTSDDQFYTLSAISYVNHEFEVGLRKNPGWPLFVSIFFRLFESDNFLDYSNAIRMISMGISAVAILPMYLLSRKFFNEKYSLVAASLLAFEPHINYRTGFGLSEALYIPIVILTIYFILNKNNKLVYLSFVFAGLLAWIRIEGIILFFIISLIFFVINKKTLILIPKYLVCLAIIALVITPFLIQRAEQFDDPFIFGFSKNLFVNEISTVGTNEAEAALNYIANKGPLQFIQRYIITGAYNIIEQTARMSAPYLMLLLPFGAIFSLRAFDQDRSYIKANWIVILGYAALMIIPFAVIPERRFLFVLYPFLIIFSVLAIQRVTEYGLNTFSFSQKSKNVFLVLVLSLILLLSSLFMLRYDVKDPILEHEEMEFANFLTNDLDGLMLDPPSNTTFDYGYFRYSKLNNPPGNFNNFRIMDDPVLTSGNQILHMNGRSLNEIILNAKTLDAKYLLVDNNNGVDFLDDIYDEKHDFAFLTKIYDTKENGMKILTVKVFEIDYEKFD